MTSINQHISRDKITEKNEKGLLLLELVRDFERDLGEQRISIEQ